jgi:outer membrane receptor protein involved in Fe transport
MSRTKTNHLKAWRLKPWLLTGASALAATAIAGAAAAQDGASPEEAAAVEEVVVVGSQIKGARVTGTLPVTVLETEDIEAAAPMSGDEMFRAIPQAGDVSFNEGRTTGGINDARGDTASINLRGLGTGNTLMLLNGRRMVLHPAIQVENLVPVTTVNTNAIPVAGVRRIEVLRDGASAIYGTDAVAGVINTVLKNNFQGVSAEVEASKTEDSDQKEYEFDFELGRDFNDGKTNISLFGSYRQRDALWATERDFSRSSDLRPLVANTPFAGDSDFDNRSSDTVWGEFQRLTTSFAASTTTASYNGTSFTTSGIFHVQPATNDGCIVPLAGGVCYDNSTLSTTTSDNNLRYDVNRDRTLQGEVERLNLFAFANHQFDNGMEAFAEIGYYHSDHWSQREQDTNLANQRLIIPITGYWNPFGPTGSPNRLPNLTGVATTGVPIELLDYRPVDAGPQTVQVEQSVERYLGGLRGEWRGFDWESAVMYSRAETTDNMRSISLTLFQQALSRTTPDAYNPFNGGDPTDPTQGDSTPNPTAVTSGFIVPVIRQSHTSMALWDFKVSKPDLFALPGGDVGVAAGVELRRETYGDDRDHRLDGTTTFTDLAGVTAGSDVMGVSPTPDTSGARNVQSAYLEFAIPVVGPEQQIPLVKELNMQVAGRFENYSVFGSVAKPKVALSWVPFEGVRFRGAWSQGFRAPSLPQQYERGIMRSNTRTDWIRCEAQLRQGLIANFDACGQSQSVVSNRSGSTDLDPEESENFTAGVVLQPQFIPAEFGRLTFTLDYWKVEQTDLIGILGDSNQITLDYLLRTQGSSNPNVVRAAPTPADDTLFNSGVTGLASAGRIVEVIDNYRNLGPREVDGIDIGVFYEIDDTPFGDFDLKLNFAKLMTFYQTPGPEQQLLLDAQDAGLIDATITIPGAESLIEQNGRPEWRASGTLTWRKGNWGAGWFTSYVGPVNDTSAALADGTTWRVESMQTHNLYVQYTFEGDSWLDGMRVRVGARNIFDEAPPLADADIGYIGDLHSPRGRVTYVSLRKRF